MEVKGYRKLIVTDFNMLLKGLKNARNLKFKWMISHYNKFNSQSILDTNTPKVPFNITVFLRQLNNPSTGKGIFRKVINYFTADGQT